MRPIQSATGDAGSAPDKHRKVMTLQEKVKLLDIHYRSRSAVMQTSYRDKLIQDKDHCKKKKKKRKEIHQAVTATIPVGEETLYFLQTSFLSHTENVAFMWVQD